jgi:hypothetical protein
MRSKSNWHDPEIQFLNGTFGRGKRKYVICG